MLHSASRNHTRAPRIITNPPVSLKEPFNFNRESPEDYSIVEKKTLKELGVDKLDFKYVDFISTLLVVVRDADNAIQSGLQPREGRLFQRE